MKVLLSLLLMVNGTAFAAEKRDLRALVTDIAVSFPRAEMSACAGAHPDMADQFQSAAIRFSGRIEALLADMAAQQALLAQPVPDEFFGFQSLLATQDDTGFRIRTLQECRDRIIEFDSLPEAELRTVLAETAGNLSGMLRQYRENMERAMGKESEP
jgi:hypothetical protein